MTGSLDRGAAAGCILIGVVVVVLLTLGALAFFAVRAVLS